MCQYFLDTQYINWTIIFEDTEFPCSQKLEGHHDKYFLLDKIPESSQHIRENKTVLVEKQLTWLFIIYLSIYLFTFMGKTIDNICNYKKNSK